MDGLLLRFRSITQSGRPWEYYRQITGGRLQPLAIPALALGTLALAAASGFVATRMFSDKVQLALAGLFGFWVAFFRPDLMILLVLAMSSTIVEDAQLPSFRGFTAIEMCLMVLLGVVMTRALSSKRVEESFVRTPLDWPVFLFFVASTISNYNGLNNLGTVDSFVNYVWRRLLNYLIFFAVTNLIRTRRQLTTLVGGMFVMATVVAVLMIAQQAVGTSVSLIPSRERVATAAALGQAQAGVARVALPGVALVYVMLLPAFVLHVTPDYLKAHKWLSLIPVVLLPVATLFTFTRSLWLGAVLSGSILVLFPRVEGRRVVLLILILAVSVAVLVPLLIPYFPRVATVVDAVTARFASLFAGEELVYDSSTQWRLRENDLAIAKFKEYPILGIGPKGVYRTPWSDGETDQYGVCDLCRYIHNSYLYLLVDLGIVGVLPVLWFSILFLLRGFSAWRTVQDLVLRGIIVGFTLSYIAVLVTSVSSPRFTESYFIPVIGVALGINEVALRLDWRNLRSKNGRV